MVDGSYWGGGYVAVVVLGQYIRVDNAVYTDGSVTKDQSGWGFTIKQSVTTIHEDSDNGNGSSHTYSPLDCLER